MKLRNPAYNWIAVYPAVAGPWGKRTLIVNKKREDESGDILITDRMIPEVLVV